jgi:hypothetical protein
MYFDQSFDDAYISRHDCTQLQLDDVAANQFSAGMVFHCSSRLSCGCIDSFVWTTHLR